MSPMITHLARRARGAGVVSFAIWIIAGWVMAQTSGQPESQRRGRDPASKQQGTNFDPIAACDEVVQAHNRIRSAARQPALTISARLQAAADRHARDMAARGQMNHKGGDGSTAVVRIKATGYDYRRVGENVAAGYFTTEGLMKGWMDSPHHKRNILGSYSQIGVACATAENGKRYWCVTFGLPMRR